MCFLETFGLGEWLAHGEFGGDARLDLRLATEAGERGFRGRFRVAPEQPPRAVELIRDLIEQQQVLSLQITDAGAQSAQARFERPCRL